MSTVIGTYEAKAKFSELLRRVQAGESFTITRNGERVADITPIKELPKLKRKIGCMKEFFGEMSTDFNDPLPEFDEYQ
jgi:prevent-host-death family protein